MLIGLDANALTELKTGVGHYTCELARALADASPDDEFELAYPAGGAPLELGAGGGGRVPPNLRAVPVRAWPLARRKWSLGLTAYARRRRPALFHGTNYVLPLRPNCPTVLTIHDLSAFLHPSTHASSTARALRRRLPLMARAATLVITPTEAVRREACAVLGLDPAKVFAVPEAPRAVFRPLAPAQARAAARGLGVEGDFILAVGTVEPRKNLLTLVRAFETLTRTAATVTTDAGTTTTKADADSITAEAGRATAEAHPTTDVEWAAGDAGGVRLVIAGKVGWLTEELFAHVASSPARGRIQFTGYVSDEALRALYSSCLAFVFPSLYEGFGLPPLEAMACGAAVVASRVAALDETLGREASLDFAPADADELASRLSQVLADPQLRARLSAAGLRHAARFTWERAARLTRDVYLRAAGRESRE